MWLRAHSWLHSSLLLTLTLTVADAAVAHSTSPPGSDLTHWNLTTSHVLLDNDVTPLTISWMQQLTNKTLSCCCCWIPRGILTQCSYFSCSIESLDIVTTKRTCYVWCSKHGWRRYDAVAKNNDQWSTSSTCTWLRQKPSISSGGCKQLHFVGFAAFLQGVSIACYADALSSLWRNVHLSVRPSACHIAAVCRNDT